MKNVERGKEPWAAYSIGLERRRPDERRDQEAGTAHLGGLEPRALHAARRAGAVTHKHALVMSEPARQWNAADPGHQQ